ncbi:MAG: DUF4350 domain-containing protein, partial [Flavisolibacter sp.]
YGTAVAKKLLPEIFPGVPVNYDTRSPGNWESVSSTSYNQAVILVSIDFDADRDELATILNFARQGNYVFIIAKSFSSEAHQFFNFSYNEHTADDFLNLYEDSLSLKLMPPVFASSPTYIYPGKKFSSTFIGLDTTRATVLGRDEDNRPDFISFKTGNGRIFIHIAPLAFSNYFILHKKNIRYYQQVMSVIPSTVERVLWNEYYRTKASRNSENQDEPNMFRVLMNYPAFKWGLLTGLFTLFLLALLGSRRKQQMIPVHKKPQNDSLVFVKTMGRLYHDRRDHHNLAKKMGSYFLEHVRSVYKISTNVLDDGFITALHQKSGYPADQLNSIISFISYLEENIQLDDDQLAEFHRQLELFYQNT